MLYKQVNQTMSILSGQKLQGRREEKQRLIFIQTYNYIHLSAAAVRLCVCCVCVLREPSLCGPPAVYRGSAEPQTGPHLSAWLRGSAAWPGSSWDPLHQGPR